MVRRSLAMVTLVVVAVVVMGIVVFRGPLLRRGIEIGAGRSLGGGRGKVITSEVGGKRRRCLCSKVDLRAYLCT